jgi:hypothetical protein
VNSCTPYSFNSSLYYILTPVENNTYNFSTLCDSACGSCYYSMTYKLGECAASLENLLSSILFTSDLCPGGFAAPKNNGKALSVIYSPDCPSNTSNLLINMGNGACQPTGTINGIATFGTFTQLQNAFYNVSLLCSYSNCTNCPVFGVYDTSVCFGVPGSTTLSWSLVDLRGIKNCGSIKPSPKPSKKLSTGAIAGFGF